MAATLRAFLMLEHDHGLSALALSDLAAAERSAAPRLNLGAVSNNETHPAPELDIASTHNDVLQSAWMSVARQIIANTDDVGSSFAEEARKIH